MDNSDGDRSVILGPAPQEADSPNRNGECTADGGWFDRGEAGRFLGFLWGQREGYAALAFGIGGRFESGKLRHDAWRERFYGWPVDADRLCDDVADVTGAHGGMVDVYVCPLLRHTERRTKGNAVARDVVWADRDASSLVDDAVLAELSATSVYSGSEGHEQVYVGLSEDVAEAVHSRACRSLADRLGSCDAKHADNDVLRLPGTVNTKTGARVRVRRFGDGRTDAHTLGGPELSPDANGFVVPVAGVPVHRDRLPASVRAVLTAPEPVDRSKRTHRLVAECRRAGLSLPETVTVAREDSPTVDKYGDAGRLETEVARSWAKAGKDSPDGVYAGDTHRYPTLRSVTYDAYEDSTAPTGRRLRVTRASEIRSRPVHWLWEERIPTGTVTFIAGRPDAGKSTLLVWLAAQITTGSLLGVHQGEPKSVLYVSSEDSWEHTIVPRLTAAGADLELVYRIDVAPTDDEGDGAGLTFPTDCAQLVEVIGEYEPVMVALDPLMSTVDYRTDTHNNRAVRRVLEPVAQIASETDCTVVGLAHFVKSGSGDPLASVNGSSGFGEIVRSAIGVASDPDAQDGSRVLSQLKNNLGRADLPSLRYVIEPASVDTGDGPTSVGRFRLCGTSDRSVGDIRAAQGDEDPSERTEAATWLRDYLTDNDGEAKACDVLKAAAADGFSKRTIQRARERVGVTTQRRGFGKGGMWLWSLDELRRHGRSIEDVDDGSESAARTDGTDVTPTAPATDSHQVTQPGVQCRHDGGAMATATCGQCWSDERRERSDDPSLDSE